MEEIVNKYINKVERAIDHGLDQERWMNKSISQMRTKLDQSVFDVSGMSTPEVRIFLNELVDEETNYLEIGVNRGSTLISALYKNKCSSAIAIDDYGGPFSADDVYNDFLRNCKNNNVDNYTFIRNDSFNLKEHEKNLIKNINTYFYDGGHSEISHEKALTYYYDILENVFIFIVDDWVHQPAVAGTLKAIEKLNLKVHKKWELGYSQHLRGKVSGLSWHNGLYIAVLEK
jgi:hypothetical protein